MSFLRLLLTAGLFGALVAPGAADIRDTKHNLSGQGGDQLRAEGSKEDDRVRMEREVCVFCHTPDVVLLGAADGGVGHQAPVARWQKAIDAAFTFELFDDIGRAGTEGPSSTGSVSVACLSCHDSVQAFGVSVGQEDHPFGVPYRGHSKKMPGQARQERDRLLPMFDSPFRPARLIADDSEFRPANSGIVNQRQVFWAARNESAQRTKNDLPLYPRRIPGPGEEVIPFVECTSCHDPHSTRQVFLRVSNEKSQLCQTCHVK
jgi:predicted CXXCH cytochrome family protein